MNTTHELLRRYVDSGSEAAFAELVAREVDFVYAVALRMTVGDTHLAEDVTQQVFITLARKARSLAGHPSLAGWLHTTTRYTAGAMLRGAQRQRKREQEAFAMNENTVESPDNAWVQLEPLLDNAVGCLSAADREAVLLKYFQGKSHREVGELLGLGEATAQKRISRALEKMRGYFARQGVTVTPAVVLATLTTFPNKTAPASLAGSVASASLAGAAGGGVGLFAKIYFTTMKIKTVLMAAAAVSAIAIIAWQQHEIANLKSQGATLADAGSGPPSQARSSGSAGAVAQGGAPSAKPTILSPAEADAQMTKAIQGRIWRTNSQWYHFLEQLNSADMPAVIANAQQNGASFKDLLQSSLFGRWAEIDPAAAIAYAQTITDNATRDKAMSAALAGWAQNDPAAATQWVQQIPDGLQRDQAIKDVIPYLAWKDPPAALQLASPDQYMMIFHGWVESGDTAAAEAGALQLPAGNGRSTAVKAVAESLAAADLTTAVAWVNGLANDDDNAVAVQGLLPTLTDKDPVQAANFAAGLPTGNTQNKAMSDVLSRWTIADPAAAGQWIQTLPQGDVQQQAVQTYVTQLSRKNPAAAAPWTQAITDDAQRSRAIATVARDWAKSDSTAATNWVNQTNLSDDDKQKILGQITPAPQPGN